VAGQAVQRATADASGRSLADVAEHLTVTATPNTTVLHLHFTAPGAKAATAGVRAAATTFLHQRTLRLQAEQRSQQTVLRAQADSLAAATGILDREVSSIKARVSDRSVARAQTVVTRDRRSQLLTRATEVARQSARIDAMTLTGGRVTGSTEATRSGDPARVALVSGLTAGLGLGLLLAMVRGAAGPRLLRLKEPGEAPSTWTTGERRSAATSGAWPSAAPDRHSCAAPPGHRASCHGSSQFDAIVDVGAFPQAEQRVTVLR
jgi:hypothetical protein